LATDIISKNSGLAIVSKVILDRVENGVLLPTLVLNKLLKELFQVCVIATSLTREQAPEWAAAVPGYF
jgi:hypothetical protein